tara:strand:- start:922 stop:1395 length:474 start_codon:yes stop_codon:yes gene_type:complete
MPTDPQTGERLPYPGEPGYTGDEPAPETKEVSDEDVDALLQQIDAVQGEAEAAGEPAAEGEEGGEGGQQDLTPLTEMLGVTPERAETLYEAAQQLASTQGKSPEDLAKLIADDFNILMQLEVIAARSMQNQPEPPAAPPVGPEAAGMPPEMAPPEGM